MSSVGKTPKKEGSDCQGQMKQKETKRRTNPLQKGFPKLPQKWAITVEMEKPMPSALHGMAV